VFLVLEELVLDVAVADAAGFAAQRGEAAENLRGGSLPERKPLHHAEKIDLGLDAAGAGTELVNRLRRWVGDADGEGCFEPFGVLA
jgi:hypothetical protein